MLTIATVTLSCLLLTLAVAQSVYVIRYQQFLASDPISEDKQKTDIEGDTDDISQSVVGPAAILLCLRGVDPSLSECLKGIARQDYLDFQVHIVFDHPEDPAVEFVRNFFASQSIQPVLHFNTSPPKTCSLKCSSLVTAIEALPQEIKYVALIDADTAADKNWLIDLLAPFADPAVGATTGNRWFTPCESNFGTVFRKVWNSAAVPQVALYNIGWGGSLAFRRDVLETSDLLDKWQTAFCEDSMVADALALTDLKLRRAPTLIMENTESTTLADAFPWIVRQLLTVRLHNRTWPMVLVHGASTAIACYLTPLLVVAAWATGDQAKALTLILLFLLYQIINVVLLMWIDRSHKNILTRRANGMPVQSDASGIGMTLAATVLNQFFFPVAVYKASTMQLVRWRGIDYEIKSGNRIEMQAYVPYHALPSRKENESAASIH